MLYSCLTTVYLRVRFEEISSKIYKMQCKTKTNIIVKNPRFQREEMFKQYLKFVVPSFAIYIASRI